jgi:hypothetical protein
MKTLFRLLLVVLLILIVFAPLFAGPHGAPAF